MEGITGLLDGFAAAATPQNLAFAFVGVLLGTLIGVLPGIGPALTIALLLPVTYSLPPSASFIMFGGIYYGAMYGGSTTSILLNTPGEAGSIMTAIEGNKMARAGRAAAALATAAIGSFIAGTIATLALAVAAPYVVAVAIHLGPADYLTLMVVAFVTVGLLLGGSPSRGFASVGLGLVIGIIGMDAQTGVPRFNLGIPRLLEGIDSVVLIVGLFALAEALYYAAKKRDGEVQTYDISGSKWMTKQDWKRSWKPWLRGTAIGWPLGAIPVGGAEVPTFLSYAVEKRMSKHPEEFGHGAIEGVAGPEAANNANAAGVLMPLLTLGVPTSATAAVILVAFQEYGLQPGPLLLEKEPQLVWGLVAALLIGNAMLLILNLPLVGMWAKVLRLPPQYLYAGIIMFSMLGAYTLHASTFDILLMLVLGLIGFAMKRYGYPVAPLIIAAILGPLAEVQLRRALAISAGDPAILVSTPFSIIGYLLIVGLTVTVVVMSVRRRREARQAVTS